MQKNPIETRKWNSKTISLHSRGEKELLIHWSRLERRNRNYENYFPISRGEGNLNCFQNDNKTRLVKLSLSARGKGHEILQGERDMKFWFSRVREKIWIISPRDFHGIEPLDSVWVGHLCCEPPTGGITIITIVRAKVLLTLVCSTVHFRHSCHSCTF